jgi:hypothetical protein
MLPEEDAAMKSISPVYIAIAAAMCAAVALGAWRLDGPHFGLLLGALAFGTFVVAWAATVEESVTNLARRTHSASATTRVTHGCACCITVDSAA